jgi:hypothetical protein
VSADRSDPDPDQLLATIAGALQARVGELAGALTDRILAEEGDLSTDKAIAEALSDSVLANVTTVLRVFTSRADPGPLTAPDAAIRYARLLAQRGVPISSLLRAYRLGQAGFHQVVIEQISGFDLGARTVAAAAERLSAVAFDYVDRISEDVVAVYQQERDGWVRSRAAARSSRVMALLQSSSPDAGDAERTLGYRLGQSHVGVVAWIATSVPPGERLPRLERSVAKLAADAGCLSPPLQVAADDATLWAWLPRTSPGPFRIAAPPTDSSVFLAIGEPGSGLEGFRVTHRQARQAQVVALAADLATRRRVTSWADVGPIALMCTDRDALAGWVQYILGELAAADDGMTRLRETLLTFLATGGSYTSSSKLLHLHKNTVQCRVRKAQDSLAHPLETHRLQIEVALQACHWLGSAVLTPVDE